MDRPPQVHCFPSSDPAFLRATQEAVAGSWQTIHNGERLLAEVRAKLHAAYPRAEIRPQTELARLGGEVVWYVFRGERSDPAA